MRNTDNYTIFAELYDALERLGEAIEDGDPQKISALWLKYGKEALATAQSYGLVVTRGREK